MATRVNRQTVDLSSYPDLAVVYLGMRVNRLYGLRTLMGYGPQIGKSADDTRSEPHRLWWRNFLRDSGGTGFWHETYLLRGGMEAVYDDIPQHRGFAAFAPVHPARGAMFGSAARVGRPHDDTTPVVAEDDLYG
ncbi:monooxygenase family protein [Actinoplanes sp. NPDC000266]